MSVPRQSRIRCAPILTSAALLAIAWVAGMAGLLPTPDIRRAAGAELTPAERKFLARLSSSVIVGNKMLTAPDPNLVELDALAESGPEDLRTAATLDLFSWAMSRRLSPSAENAWKAAEAQGQTELYMKWLERAARHFDTHYKRFFPFPLNEFIVGRQQAENLVQKAQTDQLLNKRLQAVAYELHTKTCIELQKALAERGRASGLRDLDPRSDATMLAEIAPSHTSSLMANLTSRADKPLTNVIVISHTKMVPFEPKMPEAAKLVRGLNDVVNPLVGFRVTSSDTFQDTVLLDQWIMGRDFVSMVFMPTLAPRQKIGIPVCKVVSGECAQRCSVAIFCDEFMIAEMPVVGLAAYQRKDVAQRLRRGVTAFDDGKPRVVADTAYEQAFQRARSASKK